MIIKHIYFFLLFLYPAMAFCLPKCYFEHYGVEDGLPQSSIMYIMQDSKDFMWFATWNGMCKFDGYNFYTYKINQNNKHVVRSNRIDLLKEDKYGYIWTLPYDREPLRFDPRTEKVMGLRSLDQFKHFTFSATDIVTTHSGKVWLLSENMGTVCVLDSLFNIKVFNTENGAIHGNNIYKVHEDTAGDTWILSDNGLYLFSADNSRLTNLFSDREGLLNNSAQSFYSVMETDEEIWFGSDNGRIWRYDKQQEAFSLLETGTDSHIQDIKGINGNQILITTGEDGFYIYHNFSGELNKYTTANLSGMRSNEIISCYVDKSKNIWLELNCLGVSKFDLETKVIKHFEMEIESTVLNVFPPNFYIVEDKENRLWVHPRGGGFALYDRNEDQLLPFYNDLSSPDWRFSNVVQVAFSDKQGNLWMSTRSHGLEKIIFNNDVFNSALVDSEINSTIKNDIRALFEDAGGNLWVSTKGERIFVYDSAQNKSGYICKSGKIEYDVPLSGICYCIMQDNDNNIWIGTKGEGIYKLTPTNDPQTFKIDQFKNNPSNLYSLSHNDVYSIHQDKNGKIWIGTYGGGLNLLDDIETGRFINYKNNLKNYPSQYGSQIRVISSDKHGNICIGTTLGLIMFDSDFNSLNSIEYRSYNTQQGDKSSLSGNDIYDICTTGSGDTYLATFGGGVNRVVQTDEKGFPIKFRSYGIHDGLPSDVILTIVEDEKGNLWISTEGNLTKYDPEKNAFETYSEVNRLLKGQTFSENSRCLSRSGNLFFGFSKGLLTIDPGKVNTNMFKPYVALTKFQIANKDVAIGENTPLKMNLDDIRHIELKHTQNFINIEFVALDYIESKRITYAYKLEGFDRDWIITQKQRIANYSNLPSGKYVFRVKSTNSDGIWMDNEHTLNIEIRPSFWNTGWAYLIYAIIFGIVVFIALRIFSSFYQLENRVRLEKEETELKTRFFTDISHEIRTPLTMIVSPVENILEDSSISDEVHSQLQLVLKNANRMLRMVNQILDFRKIQKQNLNIQEIRIAPFVQEVCNSFSKTAEEGKLNLRINNYIGNETLWVDRDSFEKLLYNLLSNAFKYTQPGKTIEVTLAGDKKDNVIAVTVKDEGKGMTKDILNKLFIRFASFNKDKSKPSTGIGLSIVKEVADRHHAKISVESELNKGSSFTVIFPKGMEHFRSDEGITFVYGDETVKEEEIAPEEDIMEEDESVDKKDVILVVEDDTDLRRFITTILSPHYDILEAGDGKEGYELALKKIPDFIVSDIMMPEMDGVELLQKIRGNDNTSHIPFILLTAKSNLESKLSGLDYGADDYITKPFSVKYLRARIDNIIRQRRLLYHIYTNTDLKIPLPDIKKEKEGEEGHDQQRITPHDEIFLLKVKEEIEKNIDDSEFHVDDLVSNMAMSRTVFFKKLKSLTGMAPIEFIRDIKIKYAARLIATQEYTIKEVSFMIGISDTKYFTRCFKSIFGMTPSEYKTSKKTD